MANRNQERTAIELFIESVRTKNSLELAIPKDHAEDFPDCILSSDPASNNEIWVKGVQAGESGELPAAERHVQRLDEAAADISATGRPSRQGLRPDGGRNLRARESDERTRR